MDSHGHHKVQAKVIKRYITCLPKSLSRFHFSHLGFLSDSPVGSLGR
jgi:hypothetical protein